MVTLIVSDNSTSASQLRSALAHRGHECPASSVVSLDAAADALQASRTEPELILVVLSADLERSELALRAAKSCAKARVIAIGPRDSTRILNALHAGAADYVDEKSNFAESLAASLDRLASATAGKDEPAPVVTVASGSGGCGRTTLAVNLAALAAAKHGRCALFDLHLGGGNAAAFLNLKPKHTVVDLCRNLAKLDREMFEQSLLAHETGLHLLPAPLPSDDVHDVTVEGVTRILRLARAIFPCVVVDLADFDHPAVRHVLRSSTDLLLVSRLDFAAIGNAHTALERLGAVGVEREKLRIVMNRQGQAGELPGPRVEQALGSIRVHYLPDDPKAVNVSVNCGRVCVVESPRSKFATALGALARSLDQTKPPVTPDKGDGAAADPNARSSGPHRFFKRLSLALS